MENFKPARAPNAPKPKSTRVGILLRAPDKALIKRLQKRRKTPLGQPSIADIVRAALLALAAQDGL